MSPDPIIGNESRPHFGITLVELVVVMAMVALLLGLLLPAISRAGAAGRSVECLSNVRQMSMAAQQYAMVFEAWPGAILYERPNDRLEQHAWDWVTTFDGTLVGPGALWTFTDDPNRVQQCPEYPGGQGMPGDPFTGYNYNTTYLGAEESFSFDGEGRVRAGVRPHACSSSTTCAMFGDGGRAHGTNKYMRAPGNSERESLDVIYTGGQAFRHSGTTNVAYVDGHVEAAPTRAHEGEHATDELLRLKMGFPENGFLSDDDRAYDPR